MARLTLPPPLKLGPRQTADEEELVRRLETLEEEGASVRDRWVPPAEIEADLQMLRTGGGPARKHFSANIAEAFIDRMVAQLTDSRPILRVEALKAGLRDVAHALDRAIDVIWDRADVQRQMYRMAYWAATFRSAGIWTGYDPFEDEITLEPLRPDQVIIDPKVTEAARVGAQADYVSIRRIVTLAELRVRFPGRGEAVQPEPTLGRLRPKGATDQERRSLFSPSRTGQVQEDALERAWLVETWVRDWQRDAAGQLLFPGGRVIIRAGRVVLWDGPNPYWDGRWPIDWYDWGVDPDHPWGRGVIPQLRHLQLPFNRLMDGLVRNQLLTNVLMVIGEYDALTPEQWNRLTETDGVMVLRTQRRGVTIQPVPPPAFGADKLQIARQMFTIAQLLTGVTDVMLGESPGSLQSGAAIEGLQEGASLINRARASRLEDLYTRVGQKLIARIFQFYDSDRIAGLLGPGPAAEAFARARQELFFQMVDGVPQVTSPQARRRALTDLRFTVAPGSSAPGTRVNRARLMLQLYAAGLASGVDVLAAADFPEPDEMLKRAQAEHATRAGLGLPPPPSPGTRGRRNPLTPAP